MVAELYCAQDEVVVYGGYIDDGSTTDGFATLELSAQFRMRWDALGDPMLYKGNNIMHRDVPREI